MDFTEQFNAMFSVSQLVFSDQVALKGELRPVDDGLREEVSKSFLKRLLVDPLFSWKGQGIADNVVVEIGADELLVQ